MKTKPSTEYVLLGSLMDGAKHGYEIRQFMSGALDPTWFVGTSQLYLLLKRLEKSGLLNSSLKRQNTRPSKRIYRVTAKGREIFLTWLSQPVVHMRNFRFEFLAKLFFFYHLALDGGDKLIQAQVQNFETLQQNLKEKIKAEDDSYNQLVLDFKLSTTKARRTWLLKQATPFMQGK
jgi:DNA-binding PadR family transcriptional regulator